MIITNKYNLPKTFVKILERDYHKAADYSASQLTKSPRMVHLENRYYNETISDVTDNIWKLFGSAVHNILEKGETENQLVEEYFTENIGNIKLSGTLDLYEDGIIYDYKVTSVWSYIYVGDKIKDFESQLNVYGWLLRKKNFDVKALKIIMILRDWQKSKRFSNGYPRNQVQVVDIKLWSMIKAEEYIKERINKYETTKELMDYELPECTDSERWVKPPKFALMKKNAKRAVRLFDRREDAEKAVTEKLHYVEERKSDQWKRCEYCLVSNYCNQFTYREKKSI
jgi:hypothetical protein